MDKKCHGLNASTVSKVTYGALPRIGITTNTKPSSDHTSKHDGEASMQVSLTTPALDPCTKIKPVRTAYEIIETLGLPLLLGVIVHKSTFDSGMTRISYKLDQLCAKIISSNVIGTNGLQNGQWYVISQ